MATDFTVTNSENISQAFNLSTLSDYDLSEFEIDRLITIIFLPLIIIVGTIGNFITFIVMQKGSLKHSSSCFYMAVLSLSDTSMYFTLFNQTYLDNKQNTSSLFWAICCSGKQSLSKKDVSEHCYGFY